MPRLSRALTPESAQSSLLPILRNLGFTAKKTSDATFVKGPDRETDFVISEPSQLNVDTLTSKIRALRIVGGSVVQKELARWRNRNIRSERKQRLLVEITEFELPPKMQMKVSGYFTESAKEFSGQPIGYEILCACSVGGDEIELFSRYYSRELKQGSIFYSLGAIRQVMPGEYIAWMT